VFHGVKIDTYLERLNIFCMIAKNISER